MLKLLRLNLYTIITFLFFFRFTLFSALRVVHSNLVLRQFVPIKTIQFLNFRRILKALRVEWQNSTPLFTSTPEIKNEGLFCILYQNYYILKSKTKKNTSKPTWPSFNSTSYVIHTKLRLCNSLSTSFLIVEPASTVTTDVAPSGSTTRHSEHWPVVDWLDFTT